MFCSHGIGPRGRGTTATGHKEDPPRRDHNYVLIKEKCRIGEAVNPGPGINNKQLRQSKMGYFFGGIHQLKDGKAE
eukprot:12214335-Heterocapsa_arctica.AAC.1